MKNFDKIIQGFDKYIDHFFRPFRVMWGRYFIVLSGSLLIFLAVFFIVRVFYLKNTALISAVHGDVERIVKILECIDKDCEILSIRSENAVIDFLTVKNFSGSTIGCLNLVHPKRWKGPYLQQNPMIQGHLYQIVRAQDGYFVVPGNGVALPNKVVMGKDIMITKRTTVVPLLKQGGVLNSNGQALGMQLNFKIGDWRVIPSMSHHEVDQINDFLKEFNSALPFALARLSHHA